MAIPLALLLGGLAAGGYTEAVEARKNRELKEREQQLEQEERMFQRVATTERLFLQGLDVVRQLPIGSRPEAIDAVYAGIKKLGGTPNPKLRDRFITNDAFTDAYRQALANREVSPELRAMFGPTDAKLLEDLEETIGELKQADAAQKMAEQVGKIDTPGGQAAATALRAGVDPGKVGIAAIPAYPPAGPSDRLTGPELKSDVLNEINRRFAADAGQSVPEPDPRFTHIPTPLLVELNKAADAGMDIGLMMEFMRTRLKGVGAPGAPPVLPPPVPGARTGAPAGAGTGGGALPGPKGGAAPSLSPEQRAKVQALKPGASVRIGGKVYTREQLLGGK